MGTSPESMVKLPMGSHLKGFTSHKNSHLIEKSWRSCLLHVMDKTDEQLKKIEADKRRLAELQKMHSCQGNHCLICSACYKPAFRYLENLSKKA